MSRRGTYGVGIYDPQHPVNMSTLVRNARCFGADYAAFVGREYRTHPAAVDHDQNLPIFTFDRWSQLLETVDAEIVCVEYDDSATPISDFLHPRKAFYLLGNEGSGIPEAIRERWQTVYIPSDHCLNVSMAGGVVLAHRYAHGFQRRPIAPGEVSADFVGNRLCEVLR